MNEVRTTRLVTIKMKAQGLLDASNVVCVSVVPVEHRPLTCQCFGLNRICYWSSHLYRLGQRNMSVIQTVPVPHDWLRAFKRMNQ